MNRLLHLLNATSWRELLLIPAAVFFALSAIVARALEII